MTTGDAVAGVVVIGRNEGDRLKRCLRSLESSLSRLVYVDSGSTDGSVEFATSLGATVVELDTGSGFTAARARNAGFDRLLADHPDIEFVQFVDGDCEVDRNWMASALATMDREPRAGVVCGRRRERFPDRSVYNLLCDIEWNTPIGEARSCGGDALFRVSAFEAAGRYDSDVIAGEEPELCVRLRALGWRVLRIDAEMTLHDAGMTRFSQWWKRAVRSGHASAEMAFRHGRTQGAPGVRRTASNLGWGVVLPAAIATAVTIGSRSGPLGTLLYPALLLRVYSRTRARGFDSRASIAYAAACTVGKFAESAGALRFLNSKLTNQKTRIIEYKGADAAGQRYIAS